MIVRCRKINSPIQVWADRQKHCCAFRAVMVCIS